MLHRAPRRLQQEPVLGVQQPDLARRHTEERRVEPRHVIDETRATGHDLAGHSGFRIVKFVDVPAVLGHLRCRVAAVAQYVPELIGIPGTRETRCIADDGKTLGWFDRIVGGSHAVVLLASAVRMWLCGDTCPASSLVLPPTDSIATIARAPTACAASLRPGFGRRGRLPPNRGYVDPATG